MLTAHGRFRVKNGQFSAREPLPTMPRVTTITKTFSRIAPSYPARHSILNGTACKAASSPIAESAEPIEECADAAGAVPSEKVTFSRGTLESRIGAAGVTLGALGFCILSDDLPVIRLGMLTYMLWAAGEWVVHKYFMHARIGSLADKVTHLNTLHVTHHIDTKKDMTMKHGFEVDALYFHLPNSIVQVAFATTVGLVADSALSLEIPEAWIPAAAVLGMVTHNILWNTLHMGMHEVPAEYKDGMPFLPLVYELPLLKAYRQWTYDNHTTHHDVGGSANYNIVCPGPDFLLGTYMHRSKSVDCP